MLCCKCKWWWRRDNSERDEKENEEGDEFSVVENDMSTIDLEMIQAILPVPSMTKKGRKLVYKFPGFVTVSEKWF